MACSSKLPSDIDLPEPEVRYEIHPGTMDYGREYEVKVAALLSLRCLGEDTKRMWLASNAAGCSYFNHVILYRQTSNGNTAAYLIQTRCGMHTKHIPKDQFTASKGNFSLKSILNKVDELHRRYHDKDNSEIMKYLSQVENKFFIIFTNKSTNNLDFLRKVEEENPDLNIINVNGDILQLQYKQSEVHLTDFNPQYMEQLYFFMNQPNNFNIDQQIMKEMENLFFPLKLFNFNKLLEKYITFIGQWSSGVLGGHYLLNKMHILKVLTEFLFEQYMAKSFYYYKFDDYQIRKLHKWDLITENKNVTIVNMNNNHKIYKFLAEYFQEKISHYTENKDVTVWERGFTTDEQTSFFENSAEHVRKEMLMTIGNRGQITPHEIYKVLCKLNEIPFLLEVHNKDTYRIILRILELSEYAFRVVILNYVNNDQLETDKIPKSFTKITDLNEQECEMILDESIKLQGRPTCLKTLISKCNFLKHIDVENIIDVLTGTCNIGNTLNKVPAYYVKRKTLRIISLIDTKLLFKVLNHCDDICVIHCINSEWFHSCLKYLNIELPEPYIIDSKNIQDQKKLPIECRIITVSGDSTDNVNIPNKNIHYLKLHDQTNLELLRTAGSSENISFCVQQTKSDELQTADIAIPEPGGIKIITGIPGIGKTTTLDDLAQITPEHLWVLQIKLRQYMDYFDSAEFQRQSPLERLKHINKQILSQQGCANVTNMNIFETFLNSQQVLLTLDGFDEISPTRKATVTAMIRSFRREKFRICLTTRSVLKTYVEREFNTVAITLPKFTKEEQLEFLTAYFSTTLNAEQTENITRFSRRLLELIEETLNHYEEPLAGIPLHIELLAELFGPEIQTINFTIAENLRKLCWTLFSKKTQILVKRYGRYAEHTQGIFEEDQKLIALHLLFSDIDLNRPIDGLSSNYKSEILQKDGVIVIIMGDNPSNVSFVDQLLAEYLVATWISEHPQSDTSRTITNQNYGVINTLLDQIVRRHQ